MSDTEWKYGDVFAGVVSKDSRYMVINSDNDRMSVVCLRAADDNEWWSEGQTRCLKADGKRMIHAKRRVADNA